MAIVMLIMTQVVICSRSLLHLYIYTVVVVVVVVVVVIMH